MRRTVSKKTRSTKTARLLVATLVATALAGALVTAFKTSHEAQMTALDGWSYQPLFTVGERIGNYTPPGILDGIAAYRTRGNKVRVLVNHEFSSGVGYPYRLANGTMLPGARVSYFDIQPNRRTISKAGLAFHTIYNRNNEIVDDPSDLQYGGINRLCSSYGVAAGEYGYVDNIYFTGEETSDGTEFVLDVDEGVLWAAPDLGKAAWENVTPIDTGNRDYTGLLIGDDVQAAPLYLYIGRKGATTPLYPDPDGFLNRNGLVGGKLYAWKSDSGFASPQDFAGTGSSDSGSFVEVDVKDALGNYKSGPVLRDEATNGLGGFKFSRPEDVAVNPRNGWQVVFASTGRGGLFPADNWGTVYKVDLNLHDLDNPTASISILYDGDDAGNGQFPGPDYGLRSPDNLDWADDGLIYINEDRSTSPSSLFGGTSGREASMWQLDPVTGILTRIAEINRLAELPDTQTDSDPTDIGDWESSGVLDVTDLFPTRNGERLLIADVQAHSVRDGSIGGDDNLVQGGQLFFLSK